MALSGLYCKHAVGAGVAAAFPYHYQAFCIQHLSKLYHVACTALLMPCAGIVAAAEYYALEVYVLAVAPVQFQQHRMVNMQIGGYLKGGPHIVAAYHTAVQHLIGMQHSGNHIVYGHSIEHCIRIRSLVLALPYHHYPGQLRMLFLSRELLRPVGSHAACELRQIIGYSDGNKANIVIVLDRGFALVQVVYYDQIVCLGKRRIARIEPLSSIMASRGYSRPLEALDSSHGRAALSITAKPDSMLVTPRPTV